MIAFVFICVNEWKVVNLVKACFRSSSRSELFYKKGVLKNFAKVLRLEACNFSKEETTTQVLSFPLKSLRTTFLKNNSGWLFRELASAKPCFSLKPQKQFPKGVLMKRCSENRQQIYRRTSMPKFLNHFSTWVFSCKFPACFQNIFSWEPLEGCIWKLVLSPLNH